MNRQNGGPNDRLSQHTVQDLSQDEASSFIAASKVNSTSVDERRGESLGSIDDVMIDKRSGQIAAQAAIANGRRFQSAQVEIAERDRTEHALTKERLLCANTEIAQRVTELQEANLEVQESRRAALNVLEDAVQSHRQIEALNLELRERERRFREMIDALPAAIYTTDAEGRLTHFNPAAVEFSGRTPELGTDQWCVSWKLYRPDGTPMPHDECPMAIALKEGRVVRGAEAILERPDGKRSWFTPYPTPLRDAQGRIVGGINMLVDITERKKAELANRQLAAIVESSHDAIVSKDLNGVITSWNAGAERLFGYKEHEVIGKPVTILISPDRQDEEHEILGHIRRGKKIDSYETVRMRKDGSLVDISLTVSPVKDANENVVGASKIARDIGERKKAEAHQELLTREIHHRTKNLFAVVQAVVGRSFAGKQTVEDAESAVLSRLSSLAQTHVMLIDKQWHGADIGEVVGAEMSPYAGRVSIEGPKVVLNSKAAQKFGLAVHELATNAAKYGALSNATGRIDISWSVDQLNGTRALAFRWQERGGPPVLAPQRKGFGSTVLERVMAEYFSEPPRIDFAPSGVIYEVSAPLGTIERPDQEAS